MTSEFNELLPAWHDDKVQILIIGDRDPVVHTINEFYVRKIASDRAHFTPIVPAPFAPGKYMTMLVR